MRDVATTMAIKYPKMFEDLGENQGEQLGYGLGGSLGNKHLDKHLVERVTSVVVKVGNIVFHISVQIKGDQGKEETC